MIPQVNALATDRNREQTRELIRIIEHSPPYIDVMLPENLPNGSFTLCQVVGMLRERNCFWVPRHQTEERTAQGIVAMGGAWIHDAISFDKEGRRCHDLHELAVEYNFPHDLTAALDALIKVLETKGEKE